MQRFVLIIISICVGLTSCSHSAIRSRQKNNTSVSNTQKAIFEYLKRPDFILSQLTGKGLTKLDPNICLRETLNTNGKVYFNDTMRYNSLIYPLPKKSYRLVIPDSLAGKYIYTGKDKDYEHDYAIIHQFSPLLPTKEPNVFFMEHHLWANWCGEGEDITCGRALLRDYLKFKVENQKVTYIEDVELTSGSYFIGIGCFSRIKMEEALPGEKITTFIW